MKRVAFYTLGCKVNQHETEALESLFKKANYSIVSFRDEADVYIINTCTVTHLSDRKSRQMIRKVNKENPEAKVVVMGCYAQTSPGEVLAISGVDLVIGTKDRVKIIELIEQIEKESAPINAVEDIMAAREFEQLPVSEQSRTRAFLKVQEGCNQFCTYCIVPYARGPLRSLPLNKVLENVQDLVNQGFKEVVLSGTHTGAYGKDLSEKITLAQLIAQIVDISGLERLRISSVDPNDFTAELIEILLSSQKVCSHFHIPLQSGDDEILKKMRRPYQTEDYYKLVDRLSSKSDNVAFTTDVMVGFPGETETQFQNTYNFIKKVGFSDLHVFKYSPRKGTPAAEFPEQVKPQQKDWRSRQLIDLTRELKQVYAGKFIGKQKDVLIERIWKKEAGNSQLDGEIYWEGLTDNYLRVIFKAPEQEVGGLVKVRLESWQDDYMLGQLL